MKSKRVSLVTLAVVSAVVAFGVATPRLAVSGTQVLSRQACESAILAGKNFFACTIIGGDLIASGILEVYFDFKNNSQKATELHLVKWSYTGAVYEDSKVVSFANGTYDSKVTAVHAIEQPSKWDYYFTWAQNLDILYGTTVITK